MARYYLDHGAYPAYAATPTWNVAQEGDGKATGLSTPAVASFLINAVAVATNTVAVAGVTLTAVASGATSGQFNVGASTTAQADNIATAINACTTNVDSGVATGTPQLRNLMYARGPSTGAPADTVEIMTRCGSEDFNHSGNANMALASAGWSSAPTLTQFAGGVSGVWGYLINTAAIWPSAIAANGYGVYKSGSNAQPLHGPATLDTHLDFVETRTRGQTISLVANGTLTINRAGLNLVYDDGGGAVAAWAGDTLPLTLEMVSSGASQTIRNASALLSETCRALGRFVLKLTGNNASGSWSPGQANGTEWVIDGMRVTQSGIGQVSGNAFGANSSGKFLMRNSKIEWPQNTVPNWITSNASSGNEIALENVEFAWSNLSVSPTAPFMTGTWAASKLILKNVKLTGQPAPPKVYAQGGALDRMIIIADSCEGFDLAGTLIGYGSVSRFYPVEMMYALLYNMGANRGYTFECTEGYVHWWPGQDFPTYTALLPDTTPWSIRLRWLANTTTAISKSRPFQFWRTSQKVVTTSKTVVTVELLLDPTYAASITQGHLGIEVSYVSNVTSLRKTAYSVAPGAAAALASSTAAWTLGTTYAGYTKAKIALTLPDAIKQNTEIEVAMRAYLPAPTADQYVFIDPEVGLS